MIPPQLMQDAERLARLWSDLVRECVRMDAEIAAVRALREPAINRIASELRAVRSGAAEVVRAHEAEFNDPRTVTLAGWQFGFRKSRGKVEFDDPAAVVGLIRKHLPGIKADRLIQKTEAPKRALLRDLPVSTLASIGCRLVGSGDSVVVDPPQGDGYKLAAGLLSDSEEET